MRVFVSHAGRDRAWAEWVAWQVDHAGRDITTELDCWDWQAGDNFVAKMNTALDSCDHMLAIFSQAYYEQARWTHEEWTAALRMAKDRDRFLVPLRIDDAPAPPLLAPLIAPALHDLPRDRARATVLEALRPAGRPDREPAWPPGGAEQDGPRLPGVLPPVWGPVPGRNAAFTGRDGMVVRLRQGVQGSGRTLVQALNGAGGVGKTQLATEYAWRFAGDYDAVWWVNAEQADRIGEQYAGLAAAWGLVDPTAPVGPAVEALRRHCRGHGRWLVVLDNATSADDVRPWLLDGPGHTLVTSRDPTQWAEMAVSVPVDVFDRGESTALLRARVPILADEDANQLAAALGDLPLAVAQAAGVLAEMHMPAAEYLDLLAVTPAEVLDEGAPVSYPRSLAKALRVAVEQLAAADPAAVQLLELCAFLAPEPIPTRWFAESGKGVLPEPLAATAAARFAYRRSLARLSRFGLVKLTDDALVVHRLTQALLRADVDDRQQRVTTVESLLAGLAMSRADDPGTWPTWGELLPHLRALDLAGTDVDRLAWQACEAALYLLLRGQPQASHDMIAQLHDAWMTRRGALAWPTLWAATYLALALSAIGRPDEAIALERDRLSYIRKTYGDDNRDTLAAAGNLATRLAELGEHEQARALFEDTLTRLRRVQGEDHRDTLVIANNLAGSLHSLYQHAQARALAEDTLGRSRQVLGDDHPETLRTASNLAIYLAALGEYEKARALAEDILGSRRQILGDDHPDTLLTANNLALRLVELGDHEQARTLAEDTLTRRRRTLGEDHPDTRLSARLMAWLQAKLRDTSS